MSDDAFFKPIERLFPFALRARVVVSGRDALLRNRKKLHFLIVTPDLSDASRASVLADFPLLPVMEAFSVAEFEKHFGFREAKVVGFLKSGLAFSILRELKEREFPNLRPRIVPPTDRSQPAIQTDPPAQADTASGMPAE